MADDFVPGLEGVIAFETEIAEPDKDGGALRYRGVDIEDLVGKVTFGNVWALLVDGKFGPGLPPAEPFPIPVHTGDVRVDVQAALAMLAPIWGYRPLLDINDEEAREELARAAVMALSYVAQSARGIGIPAVPQKRDRRGRDDRRAVHDPLARRARPRATSQAVDAYLVVGRRARHERLHLHRPRHRLHRRRRRRLAVRRDRRDVRPAARRRPVPRAAHDRRGRAAAATPSKYVKDLLDRKRAADGLRPPRLPRRGPARPRAAPHRRGARRPALRGRRWRWSRPPSTELRERRPDRPIETNVEFWAAIVLDFAEVPSHMFTSMFTCARTAGWCAHILEQKNTGRLVRPSARYIGPDPRKPEEVEGWDTIKTKATTQPAPA